MVITYSKSINQPGKVANPARGSINTFKRYYVEIFCKKSQALIQYTGNSGLTAFAHWVSPAETFSSVLETRG